MRVSCGQQESQKAHAPGQIDRATARIRLEADIKTIPRITKVSTRCATTRIPYQTKCDNFVEPKANAVTLNFDAARRVLIEPDLVKQGLGRQRHFSWESAI
jgi:hypothetical protein